jgi:cytoskeletal protein CcmA (bactofilin family)
LDGENERFVIRLPEPNQLAHAAKPGGITQCTCSLERPNQRPPRTNRPDHLWSQGHPIARGVSIKGSVKVLNELLIDGEVEGTIDSTGTLTISEHARIRGEIRTKSVKVRGTVEGNIFATERCELQAGCTLRGDIEAPRLAVSEDATFLGSAKVGTGKE